MLKILQNTGRGFGWPGNQPNPTLSSDNEFPLHGVMHNFVTVMYIFFLINLSFTWKCSSSPKQKKEPIDSSAQACSWTEVLSTHLENMLLKTKDCRKTKINVKKNFLCYYEHVTLKCKCHQIKHFSYFRTWRLKEKIIKWHVSKVYGEDLFISFTLAPY